MLNKPLIDSLRDAVEGVIVTVAQKDKVYASSWKKRGGVGAFMMLARKWDRIENIVSSNQTHRWDIIESILNDDHSDEPLIDQVDDLIGYLLLVKSEISERRRLRETARSLEADSGDPEAIAEARRK